MMKKVVSVILAILLIATMFVGCGKSVESIDFSKTTVEMLVGESYQIEYKITPNDIENVEIVWSSSNDKVATVDTKGIVTAIDKGNVDISATVGKITSICKVNIKKPQVAVIDTITGGYTNDRDKTYTVGKSLKIDEYGQVIEAEDYYNSYSFEYDSEGKLITAKVKDDNTTGVSKWKYKGFIPISFDENPNNGFRCSRKGKVTCEVNSDNLIKQLTLNEKLTDPEDGSVNNSKTVYKYNYEDGLITSIDCIIDGKNDHKTVLTYDEKGNITSYSNVGGSMGEYIHFDISYKMVDQDTITNRNMEQFTNLYNLENVLVALL